MSPKQALLRSLAWAAAAAAFSMLVRSWRGGEAANQFLAGYLVELSLSADNVFVFALIFGYFSVGPDQQRRVLQWGIAGAAVFRGLFILAGTGAIRRFHWVLYGFGALLFLTALRIARSPRRGGGADPERIPGVRWIAKFAKLAPSGVDGRFIDRVNGRWVPTRLLLVLAAIEVADVIFAFDSLPAVLSVTRSAWIAFASNLFAVASLRSLYFALAGIRLRHLETGLVVILLFIGAKILVSPWLAISTGASLAVVGVVLAVAVISSLRARKRMAE
jgi:tellurite resistance protein TerC